MDSGDEWGEEEFYNGAACALQMQTFMDDWHYRVLHAGMAMEVDRTEAVIAALGLFEATGAMISDEEKQVFARMEEDEMIDSIVRTMSSDGHRSFEHSALQLQLIVSTATRVRGALDTGDIAEVQSIMEHGDAGITQHIMKRTVVEAAKEIMELKEVNDGWSKDMNVRLHRLSGLADESEKNRNELDRVNAEIAAFHGKQNEKAVKAITGLADQSDATLVKAAFNGWSMWYVRFKGERHIHEKYQAEIVQAKAKLKEMQGSSVSGIKRALMGNVDKSNQSLLAECVRRWAEDVKNEKQNKQEQQKLAADVAHLECLRADQKANAKRSMMRMAGDTEESLRTLAFTAWANVKEETRKQKDFEEREEKLQKQLAEMKSKSKGGAKSVLGRVNESSSTGIISQVFFAWKDDARVEVRARTMEATIASQNSKFKSLNSKQKGNAKNAAQSAIELEEQNTMMNIFMNWAMEVEISHVISHYSGKMAGKTEQLQQVQSMFKDFTSALEQGISNTPRTEKRNSSKAKGGPEKPPALPSPAESPPALPSPAESPS